MRVYPLFLITVLLTPVACFYRLSKKSQSAYPKTKPEGNLILTPFIKNNRTDEARTLALVNLTGFEHVTSYSGYFTVNEDYDSNLFFWFFPSKNDYKTDPVLVWLQGGPGVPSMLGLLTENGPFELLDNGTLKTREHSWHNNHSVIYIDNPVGTGFSYTSEGGYVQNQTAVGYGLYNAILQFFKLFPELQENNFFITGESYGGKYVPALAYSIFKNNPAAKQKINLGGLAIGNGWSDPEHQFTVQHNYLYQLGLIDRREMFALSELEGTGLKAIKTQQWKKAADISFHFDDLFQNITGFGSNLNYLIFIDKYGKDSNMVTHFLEKFEVKKDIHVGNVRYSDSSKEVWINLLEDNMKSITPWISELLSHYKILFYNGQLDMNVAYPFTVNFLRNLKFNGDDGYQIAVRHLWYVGSDLAGYVKEAGNLTEILVRNAGHMVPSDQPVWALDMITRFTHNLPFY